MCIYTSNNDILISTSKQPDRCEYFIFRNYRRKNELNANTYVGSVFVETPALIKEKENLLGTFINLIIPSGYRTDKVEFKTKLSRL